MSIHDFKLYIDSSYGTSQDTTINSNLKYNYDFSVHKKGYYQLSFTYQGNSSNIFENSVLPCEINLVGFPFINNRRVKQNSYETSNVIGLCYPLVLNQTSFEGLLYADINTNTPVLVELPSTNYFIVQTLEYNGTTWLDGNSTPTENEGYTLSLYFKYLYNLSDDHNEYPNVFDSKLWHK
jgi:hypothetical protein